MFLVWDGSDPSVIQPIHEQVNITAEDGGKNEINILSSWILPITLTMCLAILAFRELFQYLKDVIHDD